MKIMIFLLNSLEMRIQQPCKTLLINYRLVGQLRPGGWASTLEHGIVAELRRFGFVATALPRLHRWEIDASRGQPAERARQWAIPMRVDSNSDINLLKVGVREQSGFRSRGADLHFTPKTTAAVCSSHRCLPSFFRRHETLRRAARKAAFFGFGLGPPRA